MGGYTGRDPAPTLAVLQRLVTSGKLRYLYTQDSISSAAAFEMRWVGEHAAVVAPSADGTSGSSWKLYDLSGSTVAEAQQR
jgi:hypothetical protein